MRPGYAEYGYIVSTNPYASINRIRYKEFAFASQPYGTPLVTSLLFAAASAKYNDYSRSFQPLVSQ